MYIVIFRKSDGLPLVKLGDAASQISQQVIALAKVLAAENPKTAVARAGTQSITYMSSDRFIVVVVDDAPQQKLCQALEDRLGVEHAYALKSVSQPYQFQKSEQLLQETVQKQRSQTELQLLNAETEETKQIVQENLEAILKRGANLNKMENDSVALLEGTKDILSNAKELDMVAFWRRYSVYIIIGCLFLLWILWKIL